MNDFMPIKGYEEYYRINSQGEVLSSFYGIILKHGVSAGYPRVILYRPGRGGKSHHIHRLLAEHFIPNPRSLLQVNHKDGNRENFELDNLEWCTASYNVKDGYSRGRGNGWGTTRSLVNRTRKCEFCDESFQYKRKSTRFCNAICSARWRVINQPRTVLRPRMYGQFVAIELFKQGVLK